MAQSVALRIFYQSAGTSWILKKSDQATARCSTPQVAFQIEGPTPTAIHGISHSEGHHESGHQVI